MAHPLGWEDIADVDGVVEALQRCARRSPRVTQAIVKHNDGVAGRGNALVQLAGLPAPGSADEPAALRARVERLELESLKTDLDAYLRTLDARRRHRRGAHHRASSCAARACSCA